MSHLIRSPHLSVRHSESLSELRALVSIRALSRVALILALGVTSCHRKSGEDQDTQKKDQKSASSRAEERAPTPVEVSAVRVGSIASKVRAVSVLEPQDRASVRSLISGVMVELYVEEGDPVKKGQKIAKISRPGASSLLRQASSSYRKARRDLVRIKGLVSKGLAPQEELNQAQFQRDQSSLELSRLRAEARNEQITSPIAGVIVNRSLYRGETVSPGQLIVEVMDLSQVYAPLHLPDRWSQSVHTGMDARLFDRAGSLLVDRAQVSRVSPIINAETGTFKVWVSPPTPVRVKKTRRGRRKRAQSTSIDPRRALLKPGLFVTVEMTIDQHEHALLLPRESVMYRDGISSVMLVRDDHVKLTQVETGFAEGQKIEVLRPLKAGDLVVSFGQRGLKDGAKVAIIQSQTSASETTETQPDRSLKR